MSADTIQNYIKRPYHIEIVWSESEDGDAGWELANIDRAMEAWLDDALEAGDPIPEPRADVSFSGKVLVRMPPYLHGELAAEAERQGVSLNQLAVTLLARGTGAAGQRREASASR